MKIDPVAAIMTQELYDELTTEFTTLMYEKFRAEMIVEAGQEENL